MLFLRTRLLAGVATLLIATSSVVADDTRLLGGVGSFRDTFAGASSVALKDMAAEDTQAVCYRYRPWRIGYVGSALLYPPVIYSTPVYYGPSYYPVPAPAPAPAPTAYYRATPPTPQYVNTVPAARPAIVIGYQGRLFSGSLTLRPGARTAPIDVAPALRQEQLPVPQPSDSFRYDGGPASPVPMPTPDVAPPTDPIPNTVPALHRVMVERSRPMVAFPAYGERPASRPITTDPLLVRRSGNR